MGPHRRGQPLLLVSLDEDERDEAPARLADGSHAVIGWGRRHPAPAIVATAVVVALLLWLVIAVPRVAADHERRDVLGPGAFAGAVRSLSQAPRELWRARARAGMDPVLVGDTLVVAADDPARTLVGLDAVTGDRRWEAGPLGAAGAAVQGCTAVAGRVVCVVGVRGRGALPAAHVVAVDASTGAVVLDVTIDGLWVEIAPLPSSRDVVLAGWMPDGLGVARVDAVTGAVRWRAESSQGVSPRETGNIGLRAAGGLVLASALPARLVLDADDGHSLTGDESSDRVIRLQDDNVRLQDSGTFVGIRYYLHDGVVGARSTVWDASGDRVAVLDGEAVQPTVTDDEGHLLTVERGNGSVTVRAYARGESDPAWESTEPDGRVVLDAAARVVLARDTSLVGLDAASGARVWQRPIGVSPDDGLAPGAVFSDGRRIAVPLDLGRDGRVLAAFELDDGDLAWQVGLPPQTLRVVRAGSQLYAITSDQLIALR